MTSVALPPGSEAKPPQRLLVMGDAPILLAGTPSLCAGHIPMQNPTGTPQRVKGMVLRSDAQALFVGGSAALASSAAPATREVMLRAYGRLRPSEADDINVELPLHPATPPGIYEATIEYPKGSLIPAKVEVFEQRTTRIHPAVAPFTVAPGQTLVVEVAVKNLGNVETFIKPRGVVRIRLADETWHDHFHQAAKATGEQGHAPFLDDFTKRMAGSEHRPSKAKVTSGVGPLAPLASRLLRVEFTVPASLCKGRAYLAGTRLGDGQFTFLLRVIDVPEAPDPNDHVEG